MQWSDFYDNYYDWAESTIRSRISSLKEMGPADEVVDAIVYLPTEQLKVQLIRKAIRYNVEFSHEDFSNLDGELPMEVYRELAAYAGFDADDPYFDEDNMEWDDFYGAYSDWSEKLLLQRIGKLNDFGPTEDVCEVILGMPSFDCETALYERAKACGVKFSAEQLEEIGQVEIDVKGLLDDFATGLEENVEILCEELDRLQQIQQAQQRQKRAGFFGTLFGILGAFAGAGNGDKKHDSGHCDGDCANCPPHYGYRYGRWYYGHGHMYGCQRGGNGGASGRTHRD